MALSNEQSFILKYKPVSLFKLWNI